MIYRSLLVLLASLLVLEAKVVRLNSCGFPNATDVKPHTYSCNQNAPMQVLTTKLTDTSGKPVYPIDPKNPLVLDLKALNHGIQYNDDRVKVKIYSYTSSWLTGDCSWEEIPTFGLLDNIDGCAVAHNCPLTVGNLDLKVELDLSKYAAIIEMLVSNSAYQIRIELFDKNEGSQHEEIACAITQLRFV